MLVAGSVAAGGRHEISDEVLQTPTRVLLATGDDERFRLGRRLMGTALRRAGLVGETIEAFVLEVTEPPVAGLATEAEALAQLGHRAEPILWRAGTKWARSVMGSVQVQGMAFRRLANTRWLW